MLKLFFLKFAPYSFTQFLYYHWKDVWLAPFLQVKDSTVNSAVGSFCWNYATDTFYSHYGGANFCCNYAGFEVLLQLCRWYSLLHLRWWIFLLQWCRWLFLLQFTVRSFCSIYAGEGFLQQMCRWQVLLEFCRWQSVAIIQVAFFAVHYAHVYLYCSYAGDCFCCSYIRGTFK